MLSAIWYVVLLSVAVFVVAQIVPGIRIKSYGTAVLVAVVYGLFNLLFKWIMVLLALPFIILSFGLFLFIINAALLWLTDQLIEDFEIQGFGTTIIAAILITLANGLLQWMF